MGLLNKLQQAFDSHIESIVSEAIQQRQQDIVRQVKQEIEASEPSWQKVDEAWKGEVSDLQHVVDRLDSEMDDLKDTVEMQCVDADYVQERVEEIDTLDEYTIIDRIDTRVTELLENATVTIEPNI